jgi:hypothetical protein
MVAYTPCFIFLAFVLCRAPHKYHEVPELNQPLPQAGRGGPRNGRSALAPEADAALKRSR